MLPTSNIDKLEKTSKGFYEEVWHTKDGEKIPFSEVTQQHWSNIYWYYRYMFEITEQKEAYPPFISFGPDDVPIYDVDFRNRYFRLMNVALKQLELRFEGELLEWVPVYQNEKRWYKEQNTRKILLEKYKSPSKKF